MALRHNNKASNAVKDNISPHITSMCRMQERSCDKCVATPTKYILTYIVCLMTKTCAKWIIKTMAWNGVWRAECAEANAAKG